MASFFSFIPAYQHGTEAAQWPVHAPDSPEARQAHADDADATSTSGSIRTRTLPPRASTIVVTATLRANTIIIIKRLGGRPAGTYTFSSGAVYEGK